MQRLMHALMQALMQGGAEADPARRRRPCLARSVCALGVAAILSTATGPAAAQPAASQPAPAQPAASSPAGPSSPGEATTDPQPAAVPPAGGGAAKPPSTPSELPPGPAKRAILDLRKALRDARQPESVIAKPLREAVRAAERVRGARAAGDELHGGMLTRLAQQWVTTGQAVLRAVRVEAKAAEAAEEVQDLTTKLERAEALLVEQQARLGRLRAELEEAEAELAAKQAEAAAAEKDRLGDGGRKGKPRGGAKR